MGDEPGYSSNYFELYFSSLQALRFFKQKKFPPLTHAHTANIFVIDGVCKISGHENTLFGYKSRLHRDCVQSDLLEYSDVIMFGKP